MLEIHADAGRFIEALRPMWEPREPELNLLLGVACAIRDGWRPEHGALMATLEHEGRAAAAVLRTPPHGLIVAEATPGGAADLAGALVGRRLSLDAPTLVATSPAAAAFARAWGEATRQPVILAVAQRVYSTSAVLPPPAPGGALRRATPRDARTIGPWLHDFALEAGLPEADTREATTERVRGRIDRGQMYVWETERGVVSMAALARPTPNGVTVNSVYTPPELRARGYASACVAALTQHALDRGARFCCLYTDASNPTSNGIYERIGYRFVCESELWSLR